jgi:FtsH-binding integral membrane protein
MYHVVLIALIATIMLAVWNLVHSSPRAILLMLPPQGAFIAGAALLVFGAFLAFAAAVLVQNGGAMVAFLLKAHIGLWLLLLHRRDDEDTIRRAFIMMGAMIVTLLGIYYVQDPYGAAVLMILLLGAGYYVLTANLRFLDRER